MTVVFSHSSIKKKLVIKKLKRLSIKNTTNLVINNVMKYIILMTIP